MQTLVTGTPGSGKTTLAKYAASVGDNRFIDTDEVEGLCEWRELKTGKVLGLVTEHTETGEDNWYATYGWYWRQDRLQQFLAENPIAVLCGSAENTVACYPLFSKVIILNKNEGELLSNLTSPDRNNPFGKTPEQRKNFITWQNYLVAEAQEFNPTILTGNDISQTYAAIVASLEPLE